MTFLDPKTWTGSVFGGWTASRSGDAPVIELGRAGTAGADDVAAATVRAREKQRAAVASFGGRGASGTGTRLGGPGANIGAFTETQWVTMQGDVAAYPF
ncbi:hypothetical protein [Nonomuraea sp. KM88]|uniref:hypothetical protein n=1 Tax=Nonomuraea sp. KM88 TaxID=3457427 RepID=UPI003FCC75CA